jgi:hypothetical protein
VAKVESVTVTEATLFEVMQDLIANRITEQNGWQRLVEEAHVIVRISSAAEVTADVCLDREGPPDFACPRRWRDNHCRRGQSDPEGINPSSVSKPVYKCSGCSWRVRRASYVSLTERQIDSVETLIPDPGLDRLMPLAKATI